MTENNTQNTDVWAVPGSASDLWGIHKDFGTYTPEEELRAWREAVKVLDGFCTVADGLNHEPLILALVDCKVRADEEYERAYDRANRPEGAELHPREEERLKALMRRCDALSNAYHTLLEEDWVYRTHQEETLAALKEMLDEANEAFRSYRREVGLPEPGK
jgi:hypothetical protein